jgi:hypothetical protein
MGWPATTFGPGVVWPPPMGWLATTVGPEVGPATPNGMVGLHRWV